MDFWHGSKRGVAKTLANIYDEVFAKTVEYFPKKSHQNSLAKCSSAFVHKGLTFLNLYKDTAKLPFKGAQSYEAWTPLSILC